MRMQPLPVAEPGTPDTRSPSRLLVWVGKQQLGSLALGVTFGILWMVAQALMPYTIGRGIQEGIVEDDGAALVEVGAPPARVSALVVGLRGRHAASLRRAELAPRVVPARPGRRAPRRAYRSRGPRSRSPPARSWRPSRTTRSARAAHSTSLARRSGRDRLVRRRRRDPALELGRARARRARRRPAPRRHARRRDQAAPAAAARPARGGRPAHGARRRHRCRPPRAARDRRRAGVLRPLPASARSACAGRASRSRRRSRRSTRPRCSCPGSSSCSSPGSARTSSLSGRIDAGDLVAFYGYAAFLVIPLRTAAEAVDKITRALVGARRMLDVLAVERVVNEPDDAAARSRRRARWLVDERSGLAIEPGLLTCLVSAASRRDELRSRRGSGGLAAELGRAASATRALERAPARRRCAGGSSSASRIRSSSRAAPRPARPVGPRALGRRGSSPRSPSQTRRTCSTRCPTGSTTHVDERGRSFSGGQRQRLVLARALLADAEILVLVEPTSAVDAHTEARIARHLRDARDGRTTVDRDDEPARARPGRPGRAPRRRQGAWRRARIASCSAHRPAYRDVVTRGESE